MRLVFWQNCLSPHQLPYIVHLLDNERVDSVVVVAGEDVNQARKNMGWQVSELTGLDKCNVYINPHDVMIDALLKERQEESVHLFSGIRGFAFVFKTFKMSLKYSLNRSIITERPNTFAFGRANGKPLWLHRIRFAMQDKGFAKNVANVFAMGVEATKYFRSVYSGWAVHPFAYCTSDGGNQAKAKIDGDCRFCFVGSLSLRKAPVSLVKALSLVRGGEISLIGDGPERSKIEKIIKSKQLKNITLLGTSRQSYIPQLLAENDVLILPSIYDGWGAVVNEALTAGLYVICSDHCGAYELLQSKRIGSVFKGGDTKAIVAAMQYCIDNIDDIRKDRQMRQDWASRCISGKVVAKYMIDCLTEKNAKRPWME